VLRWLREPGAWQSEPEPYWHLGANPTVDLVLTRDGRRAGSREVLLIRRDEDAPTEPGKWALPGGFPFTDAPRGTRWEPGRETLREACLRELREEAGLDLCGWEPRLRQAGVFEGGGRDPRDTASAWSRSTVFALHLAGPPARAPIAGGDDACEARWFPLTGLPPRLAFDHAHLLAAGLAALER
jgi:8-oxo-dGTP diphosphatase